jgi:hypothetical protein
MKKFVQARFRQNLLRFSNSGNGNTWLLTAKDYFSLPVISQGVASEYFTIGALTISRRWSLWNSRMIASAHSFKRDYFLKILKDVIISSTGPMNAVPKAIERFDKALLA